ncbi:MAG TPA: DDE-type integrase/transposase/recombinase, partial [Chlamydiales bacterium]|nr:DDE-type integrase/transposase/recombinase [Chlamydiales bacterium]
MEIANAQLADHKIEPHLTYQLTGQLPVDRLTSNQVVAEAENFVLEDGILMRVAPTATMRKRNDINYRLVVPDTMTSTILNRYHNEPLAGHAGIKRTYARVSQQHFWFGMYSDVREWVVTCDKCSRKKGIPNNTVVSPGTITSDSCWEVVGTDILGPFPTSKSGNKYIFTFTDHFSKAIEAFAIKAANTDTIATHFVKNVVCRHGTPVRLLSDRGPAFIGKVMTAVRTQLNVKGVRTSPYHPQTNGLTERFNHT